MRSLVTALMLLFIAGPASASLEIVPTALLEDPIPGNNDFFTDLSALGLDRIVQGDVKINAPGKLSFYAHASESGFTNTFTVAGYSFTESPDISWIAAGILINATPISVTAGMLLSDILLDAQFTTTGSGGLDAAITEDGFGIFAEETAGGFTVVGPYPRIYFGYDDNGAGEDDNHDDLIVSVLYTPLPQTGGGGAMPEPVSFIVWGGLISAAVLATNARRRNRDAV